MESPKPLNCFDALQRLADYLDRELPRHELAAMEAHLAECAACTREFAFEESLIAGIRSRLRQAELPGDLARRVSAALEQAKTRPPDAG